MFINKDGDGFLDLGTTGALQIEAIAFNPDDGNLYALDADRFGFLDYDDSDLDLDDSEFIEISPDVGTCTLPDTTVITIDDVDGLQFDFTRTDASTGTFVLWASVRDGDGVAPDDVLVQIDPGTGLVDTTPTPGFTGGATCVRVSGSGVLADIDDLAVDSTDGTIYAVNNLGGGTDQLVVIDPVTGAATVSGPFLHTSPPPDVITDMEGMSFGVDGTLHGTTGDGGTSPDDFWWMDESTRDTTRIAAFPTVGDYEAVACLTDNVIRGTVFVDVGENGLFEPANGDTGFGGARVVVYIDQDDNGRVDGGDTQLCDNAGGGFNLACPTTRSDGTWSFPVGQGNFVSEVDTATLPAGHNLTTDNIEEADFAVLDFGVIDAANDYGFITPVGSGDLDITKTSDAVGSVVQGQTLTYTVVVTNNTGVTHLGLDVSDILPAGTTYVPETTTATGPLAESYRDEFSAVAYNNSDGSLDWTAASWTETNDDLAPGTGSIRIAGNELLLEGSGGNPERVIERQFDLTGAADALLRYDWRCVGDTEAAQDFVHVEVSADGGTIWDPIETKEGDITMCLEPSDADAGSESFSIASLIDADPSDSRVRFRFTISDPLETFFIDNVHIRVVPSGSTVKDNVPGGANSDLTDGVPPGVIEPSDGFALANGQSLTLTLQATVDDPISPSSAALTNLAVVDSDESSLPEVARHVDPVVSGALGDRIWLDIDGDGIQDVGEPGLSNVEVTLFDAGGDNMPGGGDDIALTTIRTDMDGGYLFDRLAPGSYFVDVTDATVPAGLTLAPGSTDPSAVFTVVQSEIFRSADFGYTNADGNTAILGDYVWNDIDRDGVQDPGEIGFSGVTLDLVDLSTGMTVASTSTASDGRYLFTGIAPGEYEVRVTDTGLVLASASPTIGPQSEGGTVSSPVTVSAGETVDDLDFGFAPDACLPRIDFDRDAAGNPIVAGQTLDNEWSAWGLTLSFTVNAPSTGPLMAFDSFDPTGADFDLGSPNETCSPPGPGVGVEGELGMPGQNCRPAGILLIISEDGDAGDPDDSGDGGSITFDFASDVEIEAVEFIDAENSSDSVELFDELMTSIFFSNLSAPGDNAYELLTVNTAGARQMVVTFPGSGSISAVDSCLGSLRDKVWLDTDSDGLFDLLGLDGLPGTGDEERGIAGVSVSLLDNLGNVLATTITDADGNIRFDGLPDGGYTIRITDTGAILNPYGPTTAPAQATELAVTISGGVDEIGVSFGYDAPGTIGDTVFTDPDMDGVRDPGESGIGGVTVELWIDANGDAVFDNAVDTLVDSQLTGADGSYMFTGLTPGTYFSSIDDTQPALSGYSPTTTDEETGGNAPGTQIEAPLPGVGDSFLDADFGYVNAALADISGSVFEDLDLNGLEGSGEPGFGGVTVELHDCAGNLLATDVSDTNGDYAFPDLQAGCYRVSVTDDAGILVGYSLTSGLDTIDVTLAATDVGDVDFGYARDPVIAALGDAVWLDANGDGTQAASEAGLSGITLELWLDGGDGVFDMVDDTLQASTVTDANGEYLFTGLAAGSYFVDLLEATLPANLAETTYPAGVDPSALTPLSDGEIFRDADFGFVPDAGTAALGDRVWYDTDGDGLQDAGEIGIDGVTVQVQLGPSCTPVICTVTTAPDGTWLLSGLLPGDYAVTFDSGTLPVGYNPIPTNLGGDDTYTITVVADDLFTHLDFGFGGGATGTIGNFLWRDVNGDGDVDAGEVGIEGVTLNLVRDDDGDGTLDAGEPILATTATDVAGLYTFSGIPLTDDGDGDSTDADYLVDVTDIGLALLGLSKTQGLADTDNNGQDDPYDVVLTGLSTSNVTADFGYAPSAGSGGIGNLVWHDLDLDGVFEPLGNDATPGTPDDEPGIEGVTIELWLDDGDSIFEPSAGQDNLLRSVATDANGEYEFLGLPASTYFVTVSDTAGVLGSYSRTPLAGASPCPGADDTSKVDPCVVTLSSGSPENLTADFGYAVDPASALSISGTVFEDEDNDTLHDEPGEPGVSAATLRLYDDLDGDGVLDAGEPLIASTGSDVNGDFLFSNLPPGDYLISVDTSGTSVDGYLQTTQSATGGLQPATLIAIDVVDQDFGFWSGGTVTTPVTLAGFEALGGSDRITFRWATATEVGNVGFNLWVLEDAGLRKLNDELIRSALGNSLQSQLYTFEAAGVAGETFVLEDLDLFGGSRYHGPFRLGESRGRLDPEPGRRGVDWGRIRERRARSAALQAAAPTLPEARSAVRIEVDREGIHRITYEQLLAAGFDYSGAPLDQLYLENRGERVPIRVVGAGTFGPGSYFEFVGRPLDTLYTRTNVYFLDLRRGGARVFERDSRIVPGGHAVDSYLETLRVEHQRQYHFASPTDDPWYDQALLATSEPVEATFDLELEGWLEGASPVSIRVDLWGVTDFPQTPDHHVVIDVNGTELADVWFDGLTDHPVELEIPDSILRQQGNALRLRLPHDTGADYDLVHFDGYEITYSRALRARDGRLRFKLRQRRAIRVAGLTTPEVSIYHVDTRGSVATILNAPVTGLPGDYTVNFSARFRYPGTYYVASEESLETASLAPVPTPSDITSGTAEMLIISHPDFIEALEPLVQARRDQGLSVGVVDVDQIYAQFAFGIVDPQAIQDYLSWAHAEMETEFVLLVGGDTYDYFDYLGHGSMSFLPTLYARTDEVVHFAPVDPLFGDLDRDGSPELAIGRFPVRTVDELGSVIAKTLEFENSGYGSKAVLAADAADVTSAYSFRAASEAIRTSLPAHWSSTVAYIDDLGADGARQVLVDGIEAGASLTSYFGHSGPTVWSFDRLFDVGDAEVLDNPGRPTVVTQWGCWNTYHVSPTYDTLGQVLLVGADRGAAAVLGAATLTQAHAEKRLAVALFERIATPGVPIGRALVEAKQAVAGDSPELLDVLWGWSLLGDPTLVLEP